MVTATDLQLKRLWVQLQAILLSGNNLGQVVHTHVSVTEQYNRAPRSKK